MTQMLAAFLVWYLRMVHGPESAPRLTQALAERLAAEWLRSIEE